MKFHAENPYETEDLANLSLKLCTLQFAYCVQVPSAIKSMWAFLPHGYGTNDYNGTHMVV